MEIAAKSKPTVIIGGTTTPVGISRSAFFVPRKSGLQKLRVYSGCNFTGTVRELNLGFHKDVNINWGKGSLIIPAGVGFFATLKGNNTSFSMISPANYDLYVNPCRREDIGIFSNIFMFPKIEPISKNPYPPFNNGVYPTNPYNLVALFSKPNYEGKIIELGVGRHTFQSAPFEPTMITSMWIPLKTKVILYDNINQDKAVKTELINTSTIEFDKHPTRTWGSYIAMIDVSRIA